MAVQLEKTKETPIVWFTSFNDAMTGFLSHWYFSPFVEHGNIYTGCEQYIMHKKALLFEDHDMAQHIMSTFKPALQKQFGRRVRQFQQEVWDAHKINIVRQANRLKFRKYPLLRNRLMQLKGEIIYASENNVVWGIGFNVNQAKRLPRSIWGQNLLGQILMELRDEFIANSTMLL